ncbi:MAG TPA: hypothetical protein VKO83_04550 [Steroidobacteraceae bacterium]|nr:hypothetical protein [Steroidobacteraceae bacterium]
MAAWLLPAVQAILPLVGQIVSSTLPVFTTRKPDAPVQDPTGILQKQITELQTAASQNALHVKELAEQLQKTVAALEAGAIVAESRFRRLMALAVAALALALAALGVALFALVLR